MDINGKIIIALDAMGGDLAPKETVKAAVMATEEDAQICVELFGKEDLIQKELSAYPSYDKERIRVIHAETVIDTGEPPVQAIKKKKDSSMVMGLYAVKNHEADAFVSCGNTGAMLVGGQLIIGRIRGIERAALGFIVPTLKDPILMIDCGANVDARPEMLVQFAQMGSIYMRDIAGRKDPKVAIVNIGEEEEKGNTLVKSTVPLLKDCKSINFTGSIESRGITEGLADVAVCDAFVGNSILKMYEGVAASMIVKLKETLTKSFKAKLGAFFLKDDLKTMLKEFSVEEYGGAPMLGLKNLVVKSHGNSEAPEIKNAILQCRDFIKADIAKKIEKNLETQKEGE